MTWSRIKIHGFHPSPRAGCCGVLCGSKWYIAGGGSRKKRTSFNQNLMKMVDLRSSISYTSHKKLNKSPLKFMIHEMYFTSI